MRPNTLLSATYQNSPALGDPVRYIYSNAAADQTMVFAGYGDFSVAALGQGRGLVSTTSWQYAIDGSMPNKWDDGDDLTYVWSMKMAHTASTNIQLFNHRALEVDVTSGVLFIEDSTGTKNSTNLVMIPTKDYMYTVRRIDANSDGTHTFEVTQENLETNAIATASVPVGQAVANQTNWWFSSAQQHFWEQSGVLGPMIAWNGVAATDVTNAQSWIRAQYDGNNTSEPASGGSGATEEASFHIELDVATS